MALIQKEIISQKDWDTFVLSHSPQALFQSWKWGEVEKKLGHRIWRWGWFEGNTLVGIAQIKKVTARRGTFLHVRHGPVGIIHFDDIQALAKNEHAWFIRISPQIEDSEKNRDFYKKSNFVPAPIHAMDAEICWVLDLDKSEEELLAGMRKTTRYEIRHAQNVVVEITKDIQRFIALYNSTSKRHNFVQHSGISQEFETLDADLYVASYEGKDLASALIVYFGTEAIYHHGASVPSKIPASYILQWEAILEAKRRGKKMYNFWGIAPEDSPNHPWRGLTVFKTGFGGREQRYMHAQDYPVHPLYIIPKTIETVRRHLKGY